MSAERQQPAANTAPNPALDPVLVAHAAVQDSLDYLEAVVANGGFCDSARVGRMVTMDNQELGPVRIPLLGIGHVRISFGQSMGQSERGLRPEGPRATRELMATMLESAVTTQPYGHLRIVVCDEDPTRAQIFDQFSVMNPDPSDHPPAHETHHDPDDPFWANKAYYYREPSNRLEDTIRAMWSDLRARELSGRLGDCNSQRDLVENGWQPAFPWRVVVLMGSGAGLDNDTREKLGYLIARGPQYGMSLMLGGGIKPTYMPSGVTNLRVLPDRFVGYEGERDVLIYRDRPVRQEDVEAAVAASRKRTVHPSRSVRSTDVLGEVRGQLQHMRSIREQLGALAKMSPAEFPYFNLNFLRRLFRPEEQAKAVGALFSRADTVAVAFMAATKALGANHDSEWGAARAAAWSMYALALANNPRDQRYAPDDLVARANAMLERCLPHFDSLAGFILDPESLPGEARHLLAGHLPEEMPPWLFHVLSEAYPDENFWPVGRCPEQRPDSAPALIAHLVKRYYPEDYRTGRWLDDPEHPVWEPSTAGALKELELMRLYGWFDSERQLPEKLRKALLWHAVPRLTGVLYPDALPEEAQNMRELVLAYLDAQGGRAAAEMTSRAA